MARVILCGAAAIFAARLDGHLALVVPKLACKTALVCGNVLPETDGGIALAPSGTGPHGSSACLCPQATIHRAPASQIIGLNPSVYATTYMWSNAYLDRISMWTVHFGLCL